MVFVDTGAWFALAVSDDVDHARAGRWLAQNREPLVTTDSVISETVTLLRARREPKRAIDVGRSIIEGDTAVLHFTTPAEFRRAWILFQQPRSRDWSFADCLSKVVIDTMGLKKAFAFDGHFRQFGSIEVVPN